jgi:hypothetical protein
MRPGNWKNPLKLEFFENHYAENVENFVETKVAPQLLFDNFHQEKSEKATQTRVFTTFSEVS